ncbi:MAG: type 2 isopentenyl-diphosphate Delta-isomerase [Corynebacterium sp.]|uniref:type 2 isopentenyl-diphosphate Delta-isomerase n=1 Tax=unclassified Corynebacterium TaxID=2624378 RepID=UPI002648EABA|nr:type 2 isopentenyl-diphosphate Delta-isomerase [Corynebacterium sp.]MDN5582901.1 type 2 isopentenyl-diphosphate Delta-isomerase [Corynebacterium sp.]MDN5720721.1 type 2 isopentenyl-diphosphate Delta-isomerase [Corynebacterium sp.]MDN6325098.1 type 2 isopentenyl-diphosphate Delta-isomerase [Corynebacterium sp.]MDN6386196.1 type 2 isopentenyl-diphosphate Delta-isomerase [Corynebacterium sp.]MDN6510184.1 type 2 isopentenyl-diphosphate Delta-isomerase [Corynebacterium sp.]
MSSNRKDDHVQLAEELNTKNRAAGGFHDVRFIHHTFNGLARDGVDTSTTVAGARWEVPFYINAMTGGSEKTGRINADLARAASTAGVAMASGSVSAALRDPALEPTFRIVRESAPQSFLFANVSPEATVEQARRAVELLDANALQVHVNPAQELVMPEGDRDFRHWLDRIAEIVEAVDVPVVVKEVGFGLSADSVAELAARGVTTVDVSGRGGTNFIDIENHRRSRQEYTYLSGWGQSTPECLLDTVHGPGGAPTVHVLASGGVRTPLDVVRALALGARAVGVSGHFLHVLLTDGPDALVEELDAWTDQVRTLMTLLGAPDVPSLTSTDVLVTGETAEFARLRGIDLPSLARRR